MTPEEQAPVAPPDEQVPSDPGDGQPAAELDTQDPAAAAQQPQEPAQQQDDPRFSELQNRFRDQGRELADTKRLALNQAAQLSQLNTQLGQIGQWVTQQSDAAEQARFAQMEPEQQSQYLLNKLIQVQRAPAPQQPPPQQVETPVDPRVAAALNEINAEFALAEPLTADEVGYHPNETAWRRAARMMALAKQAERTNEMPAKPKTDNTPPKADSVQDMIRQEVARALGTGRPNSVTPAGASKSGATIESLNKMAADPNMSPRARAEKMRQLQTAG